MCKHFPILILCFVFLAGCTPKMATSTSVEPSVSEEETTQESEAVAESTSSTSEAEATEAETSDDEPEPADEEVEEEVAEEDEETDAEPRSKPAPIITCSDYDAFPSGSSLHDNLSAGYEPSGAYWQDSTNSLFIVSDDGILTQLDEDGTVLNEWSVGGDLEGVTFSDDLPTRAFLGLENPDGIIEFDISTGQTLRVFDLRTWMTGASNQGLEGLTFVPKESHAEGGTFFAALQATGEVFEFELPILSSSTSTAITHLQTIQPVAGRGDLAGLQYSASSEGIYGVYDSSDKLILFQTDGTLLEEWSLAGHDQEGIALNSAACQTFITQDSGEVYLYNFTE